VIDNDQIHREQPFEETTNSPHIQVPISRKSYIARTGSMLNTCRSVQQVWLFAPTTTTREVGLRHQEVEQRKPASLKLSCSLSSAVNHETKTNSK
jgi:hypothetical protein